MALKHICTLTIFVLVNSAYAQTRPSSSCEAALNALKFATNFVGKTGPAQILIGLRKALEQPIAPLSTIFKSPDSKIAILGSIFERSVTGKNLAEEISYFDQFFTDWGLVPPEHTAVIISGITGLPEIFPAGPYVGLDLTPLAFQARWSAVINFRRNIHAPGRLKNSLALLHERAHQLLINTFGKKSFLVRHRQFQESFADFLPSLYFNEPPPTEDRWSLEDSLTNERTRGDHTSVLPSILWSVSQVIPSESKAEFFRLLLSYLEQNHKVSKCDVNFHSFMKREEYRQSLVCSSAYLIASIERVSAMMGLESQNILQNVNSTISPIITNLNLVPIIDELKADLPKDRPALDRTVPLERQSMGVLFGSLVVHSSEILLGSEVAQLLWRIVN